MDNLPIGWIVVLVLFYGFSWLNDQAKKQRRRQASTRIPREARQQPNPALERTPARAGAADDKRKSRASDMLPDDLWEEIEALARGERTRTEIPSPEPSPPPPAKAEPETTHAVQDQTAGPEEVVPSAATAPHRIRSGITVRSRAPRSTERSKPTASPSGSVQRKGVSVQLASVEDAAIGSDLSRGRASARSGGRTTEVSSWLVNASPEDLRRAVILHAVLGPPLALSNPDRRATE